MPRKRKIELPVVGDAFAFPIGDGRYSVCRVLVDRASRPKLSIDAVLVACSSWLGDHVPEASDPALREILRPTHHSWEGDPLLRWVDEAVPEDFIPIGRIEPDAGECEMNSSSHGSWMTIQMQPLLQWRWDHDREAVLAEDNARKAATARQSRQPKSRKAAKTPTLESLAKRRRFLNWTHTSKEVVAASRRILRDAVAELAELPDSAHASRRRRVIQQAVEAFNGLEEQHEFIDTLTREHICAELDLVARAVGLKFDDSIADEWRDW